MDDAVVQGRLSDEAGEQKRAFQDARRAMSDGDPDRVEKLLGHAVRAGSTHPGVWRLWVRSAFNQGRVAVARMRAEQAVKARPRDPEFVVLAAQMQAAAGRPGQALGRLDRVISRWPGDFRPRLLKLNLLQRLGRKAAALRALGELRKRWFDQPAVVMAAAQFYRSHGRIRAAKAVLDYLLVEHPDHQQARIVRLTLDSNLANEGDPSPVSALLTQTANEAELSTVEAVELLQALKLTADPELSPACISALDRLSDITDQLSEHDKLTLFTQAERFGHSAAAHRALDGILNNGPRRVPVALALFRKAMASVGSDQADAVASRLLQYIPKAQKDSLAAEFSLHVDGPQAALESLLKVRRKRRSPHDALKLARLLRFARPDLGLRYLRFCRRFWPNDNEIRLLHARLLMEMGQPDLALTELSSPGPAAKRNIFAQVRAHSLVESGQLHAARTELDKASVYGSAQGIVGMRLRTLISLGREEEARELVKEEQQRGWQSRISSGHFSTSLHGGQLSDLELYRMERASLPSGDHDDWLASRYIYAASVVIERHSEDGPLRNGPGQKRIPRQVFQYWNDPTPPPEVVDIMNSWSSLPGVKHVRFDSESASTFLRETFGADYERAFHLANNIAEGADLLRLCYLRHHGGFYVDADDRLYGDLNALIPAEVGMVCFREPFNILANNVIAAVPEHPAIVLASEMAVEALLARDNESTWSKTGPGMLTRAVASYLASTTPTEPADKVAILPNYILRRQVQIHIQLPHKKTRGYWNAANTTGVDMSPFFTSDSSQMAMS